jgi:hypothetical protein
MVSKVHVKWQLGILLLLLLSAPLLKAADDITMDLGEIKITGGAGLDLMIMRKFTDSGEVKIEREYFRDLMRPLEKSTFLDNIYPAPIPVFANLIGGGLAYHDLHDARVFSAGRITAGSQTSAKKKEEIDELKAKIDPFEEWFSRDEKQFFFRNESFYKFILDNKMGAFNGYKDERTQGLLQGRYFSEQYIADFNVVYDYKSLERESYILIQPRNYLQGYGSFGYRFTKTSRFEVGVIGNSFTINNKNEPESYLETFVGGLGRLHIGSKSVDVDMYGQGGGGRITYSYADTTGTSREVNNHYPFASLGGDVTIKLDNEEKFKIIPGSGFIVDKKWGNKPTPHAFIRYDFNPNSGVFAGGGMDLYRTRLFEEAQSLSFVQIDSTYKRDVFTYGSGGFNVEIPYAVVLQAQGFYRKYSERYYWTTEGIDTTQNIYLWRLAKADSNTSLLGLDLSLSHNITNEIYHELRYGLRKSSFKIPFENTHIFHYMFGYRKEKNIDVAAGADVVMVSNTFNVETHADTGNQTIPFAKARFSKYLLSDVIVLFLNGTVPFKQDPYRFYLDYPHKGARIEGGVILVLPIR